MDRLLPAEPDGLVGAYRDKIVERLFTGMLSARLAEIAQKPNAPFVFAGVGRGLFLARTKEQASLFAQVKEDGIERGLDALLAEAERAARFGFTPTELDRQKQNLLRSYERLIAEKNSRVSSSRADEYIRNFLTGETLPTIDDEYALHQRFLPQITLNDVNALAKDWVGENNRLVIVTAPREARARRARRCDARRRHEGGGRQAVDGVRGHRLDGHAARRGAEAWRDREDHHQRRRGHHRVGALERRATSC